MPVPLIHQTDLFRPHFDPDDHWDLACVYALAAQENFDLKGVLIDYPPWEHRQPDVQAVTQMNYMHGLSAPVVVGSSIPMHRRTDTQADAPAHERNGVEFILRTLRESPEPVVIQIVGSCRDVALAANCEPALFRDKCRAIYLDAGSGARETPAGADLEYNVNVNAPAYAAIFDIDCPIYWMPCFGEASGIQSVREYGTWYEFQQKEILPALPLMLQNYFAFVLGKHETSQWLNALRTADFSETLRAVGENMREMWSTLGIFHIAGLTVTREGRVVPLAEAGDASIVTFDPVAVQCDDRGVTTWQDVPNSSKRFLFHIRDLDAYQAAMTRAMKTLLAEKPPA